MSRAPLRFRRRAALRAAALLTFSFGPAAIAAEPISVKIDQATVVTVSTPASTVIVGNPAIADATIIDSETLIITGHGYGTTNLFVLDARGQRISNQLVSVTEASELSVTIHRRIARQTYSCVPGCAPSLTVGDASDRFDAIKKQVNDRRSLATTISGQ